MWLEDDRLSLSEEIIDIISERIDADVSADTPPVDTPSQEPPEALEPPIESTQETPPEPVLEAPPPPPKETKVEELPQPKPVTEAEPSFSHETETKGRETIRISTKRLDSLLLQLEDLLLIKLILQERGNQLGLISGYLSGMKKDILSMRTIFHIMEGSLYAILQVEKEKKESAKYLLYHTSHRCDFVSSKPNLISRKRPLKRFHLKVSKTNSLWVSSSQTFSMI